MTHHKKYCLIAVLFAFSMPVVIVARGTAVKGQEGCECIDHLANLATTSNETAEESSATSEGTSCQMITFTDSLLSDGYYCVPADYGASRCEAWDDPTGTMAIKSRPECDPDLLALSGFSTPDYCSHKWCFIDPMNCSTSFELSDIAFAAAAGTPDVDGVHVSYTTCMNMKSYDRFEALQDISGKTFTVAFPQDAASKYTLYSDSVGIKQGSTVRFVDDILKSLNSGWAVEEISSASLEAHPESSYTACIQDVALGLVDFCIGDFWPTRERFLIHGYMTRGMFQDDFYLISRMVEVKDLDIWEAFAAPFKVFTWEAWVGVLSVAFYFAMVMYIIRTTYTDGNYPGVSKWSKVSHGVVRASYDTIIGFTSGAASNPPDEPSPGEMVAIAGFAFFGLLVLTAYTASSAAAMVVSPQNAPVFGVNNLYTSSDDDSYLICLPELVRDAFLAIHIDVNPDAVWGTNAGNSVLINNYLSDDGNCSALILPEDAINIELAKGCLCEGHHISDVALFSVENTIPVSEELLEPMTYVIQESVDAGNYTNLREFYRSVKVGEAGVCGYSECLPDDDNSTTSGMSRILGNLESDDDSDKGPYADQFHRSLGKSNGAKASSTSGSANAAEEDSYEKIDLVGLASPIIISFLATSFALIQFSWKQHVKYHFLTSNWQGLDNKSEKGVTDDENLRQELLKLPASELLERLSQKMDGVSEDDIRLAKNSLPDTSALVRLVFEANCSPTTAELLFLESLNLSELYDILVRGRNHDSDDLAQDDASNVDTDGGSDSEEQPGLKAAGNGGSFIFERGDDSDEIQFMDNYPTDNEINAALDDVDKPKKGLIELIMSSMSARSHAREYKESSNRPTGGSKKAWKRLGSSLRDIIHHEVSFR